MPEYIMHLTGLTGAVCVCACVYVKIYQCMKAHVHSQCMVCEYVRSVMWQYQVSWCLGVAMGVGVGG